MSKRTSEDLANAIAISDPNNLESGDDEEEEVFEGSELASAADETPAVGGDDFMHTDDFRRLFVDFVMVDALVAMRWLDRKWHKVVEKKLTELEVKLVGDRACKWASILVTVDIPEGITSIGVGYFYGCSSLIEVKFPTSLTSIGDESFGICSSLEEVDLLHTKVQKLGNWAFRDCTSLREMKVPDSLQKFGSIVFHSCSNVSSDINVSDSNAVVAYLRSIQ
ncbi:hypothetical protein TrST_g383 [Triparma strigata]|uniref:Uncharacterized protein n=1 Tax=Triparma strigata TaxID=1606541 RepID=A0A9W7E3N7_9STRA|nr:hypothetical protein TrST_g383 [Triparma strigata]